MTGTRDEGQASSYPFGVDETTRAILGPVGLADLATNLWPHECQTCGQRFAGTRPALYVRAGDSAVTTASLHHPDCQPARWDDDRSSAPRSERARPLNFVLRTFQLPTVAELGGAEVWRPFLLVNPGLEQVFLGKQDGQWRVATTSYYTRFGLAASDGLMRVNGSVPDATAVLDAHGNISVVLGDRRVAWSSDCDPEVAARIRELGGVSLAVTTACYPDQDLYDLIQDFADAIDNGDVAGGWVKLVRNN